MKDLLLSAEIRWDEKVALIDSNSTVWQLSLTNFVPEKLIKLPRSKKYFGYADRNGVLYFIDGAMEKKVTQFHPDSGKLKTINSKYFKDSCNKHNDTFQSCSGHFEDMDDGLLYKEWAQFGQNYWIFFRVQIHHQIFTPNGGSARNTVWSPSKMRFFEGPQFPLRIFETLLLSTYANIPISPFCYVNMNRTHVLFFAMSRDDNVLDNIADIFHGKRVFLVDILMEKWIEWPHLIFNEDAYFYLTTCSATITFGKSGQRYAPP